jgi:hypothetical protein
MREEISDPTDGWQENKEQLYMHKLNNLGEMNQSLKIANYQNLPKTK